MKRSTHKNKIKVTKIEVERKESISSVRIKNHFWRLTSSSRLTISWKSSTKESKSRRNQVTKMKTWREKFLNLKTKDLESRSNTQTRKATTSKRITAKQSFRKMTDNIVQINTKKNNRMTGEIKNSKNTSLVRIQLRISTLKTSAKKGNIPKVGMRTSGNLARMLRNIRRNPKVSTICHKTTSKCSSHLTSNTTTQIWILSFISSITSSISLINPNRPSTPKTTTMRNRTLTILKSTSSKIFLSIRSVKISRRISIKLFLNLHKNPFSWRQIQLHLIQALLITNSSNSNSYNNPLNTSIPSGSQITESIDLNDER